MAGKICRCADFEQNQGKRNCGILICSWTHGGAYLLLSADRLIRLVLVIYFYLLTSAQGLVLCVCLEQSLAMADSH